MMYHQPGQTPVYIRPRSNRGWFIATIVLLALVIILQVYTDWLLIDILSGLADVMKILVR